MSCVSCGLPGVEGTCSMCYGDPYHNTDGEYLRWIEEQQRYDVPPCDICGGQACAGESGFNVCSEACAEEAKLRAARTQEESENDG